MNTLKQSELLRILKKHIEFAIQEGNDLHIKIEWVEKKPERIKELKEWITK